KAATARARAVRRSDCVPPVRGPAIEGARYTSRPSTAKMEQGRRLQSRGAILRFLDIQSGLGESNSLSGRSGLHRVLSPNRRSRERMTLRRLTDIFGGLLVIALAVAARPALASAPQGVFVHAAAVHTASVHTAPASLHAAPARTLPASMVE